jgi:type II secretory pathway pseudopilin PulG
LLVIAIMAILAAIVIVAINPAKQIGEAQNAQRRSDVRTILDAVVQYSLDNAGEYPASIVDGTNCTDEGVDICKSDTPCGGTTLDELLVDRKYLAELPSDPVVADDEITGYQIVRTSSGRISVCAHDTYDDVEISVTK